MAVVRTNNFAAALNPLQIPGGVEYVMPKTSHRTAAPSTNNVRTSSGSSPTSYQASLGSGIISMGLAGLSQASSAVGIVASGFSQFANSNLYPNAPVSGMTVMPYDPTREGIMGGINRIFYGAPQNAVVPAGMEGGGTQYIDINGQKVPFSAYLPGQGWIDINPSMLGSYGGESVGVGSSSYSPTTYMSGSIQGGPTTYGPSTYHISDVTNYMAGAITSTTYQSVGGSTYNIQNWGGSGVAADAYDYSSYAGEMEQGGLYYDPTSDQYYA